MGGTYINKIFEDAVTNSNKQENSIVVSATTDPLDGNVFVCISDTQKDAVLIPLYLAPKVYELLGRAIEAAKAAAP